MKPLAGPQYFSRENLDKGSMACAGALAEQAVHCLELVAELASEGLSFQFKGGNSLLLVLPEPLRLSIDADIATDEPKERIEETLDSLMRAYGVFTSVEKRAHKTKPWIPITSYYLSYVSHYCSDPLESRIMLDVQLGRSPYATEKKPVCCGSLYRCAVEAEVPLPESIIGDKLLTLGPATAGIPYGKGKEAQRLKHLFDVSVLLDYVRSVEKVRESFHACLAHENRLQKKEITAAEYIDDALSFCAISAAYESVPDPSRIPGEGVRETAAGLVPFAAHLLSGTYGWSDLRRDAARAALCLAAIAAPEVSDAAFDSAVRRETAVEIRGGALNGSPEAGYYWAAALEWLGKNGMPEGK
jgi:hypothetical protein